MDSITFTPLYMDRVWGGRELAHVYQRVLPDHGNPIGESWEIVDRESEQSIVSDGPLAGTSLHQLWTEQREALFGAGYTSYERFPILVKILDARHDLSIQVHPPANIAKRLGGEPKTEMWFISDCDKGATLYVGLKHGVTREALEQAIHDGTVADCVHVIQPNPGNSIMIPSGRLHAIGGGFLIHEIQQNSDTTYRVFDWNRLGIDGKPRALHIEKSLASIDFHDNEPTMDCSNKRLLAECPYFRTERIILDANQSIENPDPNRFAILCVIDGGISGADRRIFHKGQSILQPRGAKPLKASMPSTVLQITLPVDACP